MTFPCDLNALEAKELIDSGDLSPVDLLKSCLHRIDIANESLNAITAMDVGRAMREAEEAEKCVVCGEKLGPLGGLPIGIKDLNITAGLRTTFGSLLHSDDIPDTDEGLVARLRDAGVIKRSLLIYLSPYSIYHRTPSQFYLRLFFL